MSEQLDQLDDQLDPLPPGCWVPLAVAGGTFLLALLTGWGAS